MANTVPQGSIRPGFGSGADFAIRVIHPGLLLGSGMAGAACTAKEAGQRGGARRRAMPKLFWCRLVCAKWAGSTRRAKTKQNRVRAGLCEAAGRPPRWSHGVRGGEIADGRCTGNEGAPRATTSSVTGVGGRVGGHRG